MSKYFKILIATRKDRRKEIKDSGATQVSIETVCSLKNVILSVPISAMQDVLEEISPILNKEALVIDVCSVKEYPVKWMKEILPDNVSILATHPMFGPDSAADSICGKKIVLCKERINDELYEKIKAYLILKGLIVIETTPAEHDKQIAVSLSLSHFIGRSLSEFGAEGLEIDTEGYRRLLNILEVVENDTWQLFIDMHKYNSYSKSVRSKFMAAAEKINLLLDAACDEC
jgi:prephenate dehydrogenase